MGDYKVVLLPRALKFYKACSEKLAVKLNVCFEFLERSPFLGPNIKKLKTDKRFYRYRVGDHRVIYEIDKEKKKVGVVLISPRPVAYRNL